MTLTVTPPCPTASSRSFDIFPPVTEYTVAQAAEFLDKSEACIDGLLVHGAIKYREDGGRRLIKQADLVEYSQDCKRMRKGLLEIMRLSEEMGLYDD